MSTAIEDATDMDAWYCEQHPQFFMGHDGCRGAGILGQARVSMFLNLLRLSEQRVREAEMMRDEMAAAARRLARQLTQEAA